MKRMIAAAAIIIIAFVISFTLSNKSMRAAESMLDTVLSAAENSKNESAYARIASTIDNKWKETEAVLADCLPVNTYAEAKTDIQHLCSALECEDVQEADCLFVKAKLSLSSLRESLKPALRRLF